jgi:putative sterol carrier protein
MSQSAPHSTEFFDELARRGHEPMLERVTAKLRFQITDGDDGGALTRLVTIDHGDLHISTDQTDADATITCSGSELDDLVTGRTSAVASLLRGTLAARGDLELMVLAQRLFSGNVAPASRPGGPADEGRSS